MVLFVGSNIHYLRAISNALGLSGDKATFAQTESDLTELSAKLKRFDHTVVDAFYISQGGGKVITDRAIDQLRSLGYTGPIGACSNDPIINEYLVKLGGASFGCGEYSEDERNCPKLITMEEIVAVIEPLLQS